MAIALALGLVGIAAYYASNTSFNMLALSQQYAEATSEAQKASLQAAGRAMLAIYTGTAFQVNYIIGAVALIIVSVVMLQRVSRPRLTWACWQSLALGLYLPAIDVFVSLSVFAGSLWDVLHHYPSSILTHPPHNRRPGCIGRIRQPVSIPNPLPLDGAPNQGPDSTHLARSSLIALLLS